MPGFPKYNHNRPSGSKYGLRGSTGLPTQHASMHRHTKHRTEYKRQLPLLIIFTLSSESSLPTAAAAAVAAAAPDRAPLAGGGHSESRAGGRTQPLSAGRSVGRPPPWTAEGTASCNFKHLATQTIPQWGEEVVNLRLACRRRASCLLPVPVCGGRR